VKGAAPVSELVGTVIKHHNLVDVVRQHAVYIFWREMVGRQISSKTSPDSLSRGVLRVWTKTSSWVHQLQFFKAQMLEQINSWIGGPPLVSEIRFSISSQRDPVDPVDHLRQLRRSMWQRMRAKKSPPPAVADAVKQAIRAETSVVQDDDVRAEIERVRLRWGL
jgi:predicted nucleic acid-binding Zn ribbon protein